MTQQPSPNPESHPTQESLVLRVIGLLESFRQNPEILEAIRRDEIPKEIHDLTGEIQGVPVRELVLAALRREAQREDAERGDAEKLPDPPTDSPAEGDSAGVEVLTPTDESNPEELTLNILTEKGRYVLEQWIKAKFTKDTLKLGDDDPRWRNYSNSHDPCIIAFRKAIEFLEAELSKENGASRVSLEATNTLQTMLREHERAFFVFMASVDEERVRNWRQRVEAAKEILAKGKGRGPQEFDGITIADWLKQFEESIQQYLRTKGGTEKEKLREALESQLARLENPDQKQPSREEGLNGVNDFIGQRKAALEGEAHSLDRWGFRKWMEMGVRYNALPAKWKIAFGVTAGLTAGGLMVVGTPTTAAAATALVLGKRIAVSAGISVILEQIFKSISESPRKIVDPTDHKFIQWRQERINQIKDGLRSIRGRYALSIALGAITPVVGPEVARTIVRELLLDITPIKNLMNALGEWWHDASVLHPTSSHVAEGKIGHGQDVLAGGGGEDTLGGTTKEKPSVSTPPVIFAAKPNPFVGLDTKDPGNLKPHEEESEPRSTTDTFIIEVGEGGISTAIIMDKRIPLRDKLSLLKFLNGRSEEDIRSILGVEPTKVRSGNLDLAPVMRAAGVIMQDEGVNPAIRGHEVEENVKAMSAKAEDGGNIIPFRKPNPNDAEQPNVAPHAKTENPFAITSAPQTFLKELYKIPEYSLLIDPSTKMFHEQPISGVRLIRMGDEGPVYSIEMLKNSKTSHEILGIDLLKNIKSAGVELLKKLNDHREYVTAFVGLQNSPDMLSRTPGGAEFVMKHSTLNLLGGIGVGKPSMLGGSEVPESSPFKNADTNRLRIIREFLEELKNGSNLPSLSPYPEESIFAYARRILFLANVTNSTKKIVPIVS